MHRYPHAGYLQVAKLGENLKRPELDPGVGPWRFEEVYEDESEEKFASKLEAETGFRTLSGVVGCFCGS